MAFRVSVLVVLDGVLRGLNKVREMHFSSLVLDLLYGPLLYSTI